MFLRIKLYTNAKLNYLYKNYFVLNNLQGLYCHKNPPTIPHGQFIGKKPLLNDP